MLSGWEGDRRHGGKLMAAYHLVHDYVTYGLTACLDSSMGLPTFIFSALCKLTFIIIIIITCVAATSIRRRPTDWRGFEELGS